MNDTLSHPARADPVNNTDLCDARPSGSRDETRIGYKRGRQLGYLLGLGANYGKQTTCVGI